MLVKSPIELAADRGLSLVLSLILLAADALVKLFFVSRLVSSVVEGLTGGFFSGGDVISGGQYFLLFLLMAAQTGFFVALVLLLPIITGGAPLRSRATPR
jgi:hypothetical protein